MMNLDNLKLTAEDLDKHMRMAQDYVDAMLDGKPPRSSLTPTLVVISRNLDSFEDSSIVFGMYVPFNEDEEKRPAVEGIGRKTFAMTAPDAIPVAVVMVSEAWVAPEGREKCEPRHNPKRKEVALCMAMSVQKTCRMAHRLIARLQDKMRPCGPWEVLDGKVSSPLLLHFWSGYFEAFQEHMNNKYGETR
jgi:hypothetical protein